MSKSSGIQHVKDYIHGHVQMTPGLQGSWKTKESRLLSGWRRGAWAGRRQLVQLQVRAEGQGQVGEASVLFPTVDLRL